MYLPYIVCKVFRIREYFVRIQIRGSVKLNYGPRSLKQLNRDPTGSGSSWPFSLATKAKICRQIRSKSSVGIVFVLVTQYLPVFEKNSKDPNLKPYPDPGGQSNMDPPEPEFLFRRTAYRIVKV
jgi:hypothetical protein